MAVAKPIERDCIGTETDNLTITIQLKTPSGRESYRLPVSQLGALRTYLKILSCMNAGSAVVTPDAGRKRRRG